MITCIGDPQFVPEGETKDFRFVETMSRLVDQINTKMPRCSFVVPLGDLVWLRSEHRYPHPELRKKEIDIYHRVLSTKIAPPVYTIPGDHDRFNYPKQINDRAGNYAIIKDNILFIMTGMKIKLTPQNERYWIRYLLQKYSGMTTVIFRHQGIYKTTKGTDGRGYRHQTDSSWWRELFDNNPQIKLYIHGHNHQDSIVEQGNVTFVQSGGSFTKKAIQVSFRENGFLVRRWDIPKGRFEKRYSRRVETSYDPEATNYYLYGERITNGEVPSAWLGGKDFVSRNCLSDKSEVALVGLEEEALHLCNADGRYWTKGEGKAPWEQVIWLPAAGDWKSAGLVRWEKVEKPYTGLRVVREAGPPFDQMLLSGSSNKQTYELWRFFTAGRGDVNKHCRFPRIVPANVYNFDVRMKAGSGTAPGRIRLMVSGTRTSKGWWSEEKVVELSKSWKTYRLQFHPPEDAGGRFKYFVMLDRSTPEGHVEIDIDSYDVYVDHQGNRTTDFSVVLGGKEYRADGTLGFFEEKVFELPRDHGTLEKVSIGGLKTGMFVMKHNAPEIDFRHGRVRHTSGNSFRELKQVTPQSSQALITPFFNRRELLWVEGRSTTVMPGARGQFVAHKPQNNWEGRYIFLPLTVLPAREAVRVTPLRVEQKPMLLQFRVVSDKQQSVRFVVSGIKSPDRYSVRVDGEEIEEVDFSPEGQISFSGPSGMMPRVYTVRAQW
ncbi:MAG: metallophosphoesterase family protein [Candidatus Brocadiia bacterium]